MMTPELENILQQAGAKSHEESIDTVWIEMVLLFLLDDENIRNVIKKVRGESAGETIRDIHIELKDYITDEEYVPRSNTQLSFGQISLSPVLSECINEALLYARSSTIINNADPLMLLSTIYKRQPDDVFGLSILENNGLTLKKVTAAIKFVRENPSFEYGNQSDGSKTQEIPKIGDQKPDEKNEFLKYCTLINGEVESGRLDPLIGRQSEINEVITALARRKKNNPVLVGEAGVGKTALAEGLATKIVNKEVPDIIANANVYSLDMGSVLAGSKFRGDVEERIELVIKTLVKEYEDGGCPILFIDEIHMIVGAGASGSGAMDVSNLIKPILTKGSVRFFGATTQKEYRSIFEKDNALARRFQKIEVLEPSVADTIKILHGVKGAFEEHHGITYTDEAIVSAVELSSRHIHERKLPDKAIDLLDIAGASQHVLSENLRVTEIGVTEIETQVSKITKIPVTKVQSEEKAKLLDMSSELNKKIFGQEEAVDAVCDVIKISRARLRKNTKPIGSFLFVGPTGVGKTELTKQVAEIMDLETVRLDMSEYQEPHSVSRLLGSPPGYVGHDTGGQLTEAVRKNPHCIILLDEIEKAHPKVHEIFLQVMDNGKLTDAQGSVVDFTSSLIVMTSNAGASDLAKRGIGFGSSEGKATKSDVMKKVSEIFTPEFRNRLDAIVQFKALKQEHIIYVVDKFLGELGNLLAEVHGFTLETSVAAKDWLSENGYDKLLGARPMERLISKQIEIKAADLILGSSAEKAGLTLSIDVNSDSTGLDVSLG
jgi:ATP-dependent Clp protease ATP-binding subunit ClpA